MVEIIPKPPEKESIWLSLLVYFCFFLLLLAVSGNFLLDFFLKKNENTLNELRETLKREKTQKEIETENEFFGYQQKIRDFSEIINNHPLASKFFIEFIEKNCHPDVWFSNLKLEVNNGTVSLAGQAESFEVLSQQHQIFRKSPLVRKLNFTKIETDREGKISFDFSLEIDPNLFKFD